MVVIRVQEAAVSAGRRSTVVLEKPITSVSTRNGSTTAIRRPRPRHLRPRTRRPVRRHSSSRNGRIARMRSGVSAWVKSRRYSACIGRSVSSGSDCPPPPMLGTPNPGARGERRVVACGGLDVVVAGQDPRNRRAAHYEPRGRWLACRSTGARPSRRYSCGDRNRQMRCFPPRDNTSLILRWDASRPTHDVNVGTTTRPARQARSGSARNRRSMTGP